MSVLKGCKKCGCNLKEDNNLEEMHGGTMSKLGPREKGRKDKGKKKPQAIRQAKARTKALKQKLNTEETMNETKEGLMKVGREQYKKEKEEGRYGGTEPSNPRVAKLMKKMKEETTQDGPKPTPKQRKGAMDDIRSNLNSLRNKEDENKLSQRDKEKLALQRARAKAWGMKEESDHDKEVAKYREQAKKKTTMPAGDVGHDIHKRAVAQYNKQNPSKKVKEGFSDWRQDLREVIDKDVAPQKDPMKDTEDKEIKDKKVNNKVVMNPPMKEAFVIEEVDFPVEQIYGFLISEGYVENLFEAEDLIENATDDELADLLMEAMNRIVPGPKSAEHELKKEKDKRTKAAFALSDKEKEATAKRRKGMEDKANLERSVKKPDAEPAHKGYYSRMKGGLERTFKKPSATHPAMKKEQMSFDENLILQLMHS